MSGHNGLRGVVTANENNRTAAQLHRIALLHGTPGKRPKRKGATSTKS